jgi:hypothetical protein
VTRDRSRVVTAIAPCNAELVFSPDDDLERRARETVAGALGTHFRSHRRP